MSDRWGHTWRTSGTLPDVAVWCYGCGIEPGERGASQPCPKATRPRTLVEQMDEADEHGSGWWVSGRGPDQ